MTNEAVKSHLGWTPAQTLPKNAFNKALQSISILYIKFYNGKETLNMSNAKNDET